MRGKEPLLVAEDLHRTYRRADRARGGTRVVAAVAGLGLTLGRGETLGVVGGSGAGKSTLARLLLALERPDRGVVRFDGHPVSALPEHRVRPLRARFQAVFQDPGASLDPRLKVATIVAEPLRAHRIGTAAAQRERIREVLDAVGLPADAGDRYPPAFSGGERQRIAIARALASNPELVILDEPVASLDAPVQTHILDLIAGLQRTFGLAMVLISHDLGMVRDLCDRIIVMHRGVEVESGPSSQVFESPQHEYTRRLLNARIRR